MTTWPEIMERLETIQPVSGGFSTALRGIVTLDSGQRLFVKIGTDPRTHARANREIQTYQWLHEQGYKHVPDVVAHTDGGFALPDLSDHDFSHTWHAEKVDAWLGATDNLAGIQARPEGIRPIQINNDWATLVNEQRHLDCLANKLRPHGLQMSRHIAEEYSRAAQPMSIGNDLVHTDIRGDNIAYDTKTQHARVIDWDWLCLGNVHVDRAGTLISMQTPEYDVLGQTPQLIHPQAVLFIAGYWARQSCVPIFAGGKAILREKQFQNTVIALRWYHYLT